MKRTRFEINIIYAEHGNTIVRIYDDYWDAVNTVVFYIFDTDEAKFNAFKDRAPQFANRIDFKTLATRIVDLRLGWYAIEVDEYPFGKATRIFQIPGRHMRYAKTR